MPTWTSVVEGVVDAIWFNQGQVCCAGSRLLVQENIAERLLAKLRARMETLRLGDPLDKAVDIGAIVAPVQLERIQRLVEQGVAEGAQMWQPSWACPTDGYFYPPTLFTDVAPASTIAQVEIFGPVLVAMTFRTPAEAVALANNTAYGLAASVWSENINLALDVARRSRRARSGSTAPISSTRPPASAATARAALGGRAAERASSNTCDRPGRPNSTREAHHRPSIRQTGTTALCRAILTARRRLSPTDRNGTHDLRPSLDGRPALDRTPKLFIGGKQVRPDSGYSRMVLAPDGRILGEVGEGNRKDVRNAVEAAHAAAGWASASGHDRAQILYYLAENLAARSDELAGHIAAMTGRVADDVAAEVERSVERLFTYAAWADKYDGAVHTTPFRGVTLAVHEPIGVLGLVCPHEYPLLGLISLVAPAIAMGNTVVVIPSESHPLAATDFYSVLETSDVPAGVVNIVTGPRDTLAKVLAEHDDVGGLWYFGSADGSRMVELASASNLKRTWVSYGRARDWLSAEQGEGREFLREATQVKNIWVPAGE